MSIGGGPVAGKYQCEALSTARRFCRVWSFHALRNARSWTMVLGRERKKREARQKNQDKIKAAKNSSGPVRLVWH